LKPDLSAEYGLELGLKMRMVCEHAPSKAMAEDHTTHGIVPASTTGIAVVDLLGLGAIGRAMKKLRLHKSAYSNDAIGGLNPTGPCPAHWYGPHHPSMKNMPGASASDGQWRADGFLDCL
jgi:hypothetical protein